MCVPNFNLLSLIVPEKSVTKNWEKEKWRNKGMNKSSSLIPIHTMNLSLSMCVQSFNLQGLTVPEKSVTKNFTVWKLERKKNEETKGQIRAAAWFWYARYICPLSICVPSFNLKASQFLRKVWRKIVMCENWRKKNEEIKEQQHDSSIHDTSSHCPHGYNVSTF